MDAVESACGLELKECSDYDQPSQHLTMKKMSSILADPQSDA